jgi:hypothetical protein
MGAINAVMSQAGLDVDAVLEQFEGCTLLPSRFSHRLHLALAWRYLQRDGFPEGAVHFRKHLANYVRSVGATTKYHETITWAYLVLLNEEMTLRSSPHESFDSMIQRRPDLLDHRSGALAACYPKDQLDTTDARNVFVLPRR